MTPTAMLEAPQKLLPAVKVKRKLSETVYLDQKTGRYVTRFYDVSGKMRFPSCPHGTKEPEAWQELYSLQRKVKQARREGLETVDVLVRPEAPKGKTLRDFHKTYLDIKKGLCKPKTVMNYGLMLKNHILPKLGSMELSSIKAGDLQNYVAGRVKEGAAAETVNHELNVLSGLYREAEKAGVVDRSPVHLVDRPPKEAGLVRWLSHAEEQDLLPRLSGTVKAAAIFSIDTGLREQEQAMLTWADVDLDRRRITLHKTKNRKGREVPMTQRVYDMLKDAKECRAGSLLKRHLDCPYVFTNAAPNLEAKTKYTRFNNTLWRKALKDSGITKYRWHDNRHTFASRLKQMGVDDSVVMEIGGWSSAQLVRRYAHLAPRNVDAGIMALDRWRTDAEADAKRKAEAK